jgi:FAD:protein FMN transferase
MAKASGKIRRARPLLGTFVEVEAVGSNRFEMAAAIDAAFEAVACVHRLMSFHEDGSDVSRLNREAFVRPVVVHPWTFQVLEAALELHRRSNGVFDIAIAPHLQAMGLLPRTAGVATAAGGACAIELLPGHEIRYRHSGMCVDLGGIAKGFAVDRALAAMRKFDIAGGMVNAGGDLAMFGGEGEAVHIRDPRSPGRVIGSVEVKDEALATTGRRFDPMDSAATAAPAVIDPATGKQAGGIDGVTVRAPSCMIADALTKVVMIKGADAGGLLEHYGAGALLISSERDIQISPNLHHVVRLAA